MNYPESAIRECGLPGRAPPCAWWLVRGVGGVHVDDTVLGGREARAMSGSGVGAAAASASAARARRCRAHAPEHCGAPHLPLSDCHYAMCDFTSRVARSDVLSIDCCYRWVSLEYSHCFNAGFAKHRPS
jgi:hypothetical protein